ncbi:MAG: nucleoside monophosphate kinase [Candidatus Magasanikbacteria bacterium]|nr:nucleoside monophosphate kinase [Candidatus Magasanikbacteria bacterium]
MTPHEGQKRLILIGPQGSGKGTQGELLSVYLQIPTISTGHLCRTEIEHGTELGKSIEQYVRAGELVPDEIVIQMLKKRITEFDAQDGFIIDGFPRTVAQAEEAESWLRPTKVIVIEIDDAQAVERMSQRRACSQCRYKTTADFVAKHGDECPRCSGKIVQREDDLPEAIQHRLNTYHQITQPVVSYYEAHGLIERFDGAQTIPKVFMEIAHVL